MKCFSIIFIFFDSGSFGHPGVQNKKRYDILMKKKTAVQKSLGDLCRGMTGKEVEDGLSGNTHRGEKDDRSLL